MSPILLSKLALNKEAFNKEALSKEAFNKETINKETLNKDFNTFTLPLPLLLPLNHTFDLSHLLGRLTKPDLARS